MERVYKKHIDRRVKELHARMFRRKRLNKIKEVTQDMPWGDGKGPAGRGPMTGRAAGYCAGDPMPGYANPGVSGYG